MHVLLADSNPTNRERVAKWLTDQKHHVTVVAAVGAVLTLLAKTRFDVVLIEAGLNGVSCVELALRIRSAAPAGRTYLIALLNREPYSLLPELIAAGIDDFVRMPCSQEELVLRAQAPTRIRAWPVAAHAAPQTVFDWSDHEPLTKRVTWKQAGPVMFDAVGHMLGVAVERVTDVRAVSRPAFAASALLTAPGEATEIEVAIVVGSGSARELMRILLGDSDLSREVLEDLVCEMANTATGALKRAVQLDGTELVTGLPKCMSPATLAELERSRAESQTYRLTGSDYRFSLFLRERTRRAQWVAA